MDLANTAKEFSELNIEDKDLTMFTLTHLKLEKKDQVVMVKKIQTPNTRFEAGETGCPDGICDLYLLTTKYIIQNTKCIKH